MDSSFSLVATALDVANGFHIDSPASIAGAYPFNVALFGGRLSQHPITRCVRYAEPRDACARLSNDMSGMVAIVDRGSSATGPGACGYPDVYCERRRYLFASTRVLCHAMPTPSPSHHGHGELLVTLAQLQTR